MTDKNENNGGGAGGSIKSNSSYDTSKISFQDFMLNTLEQNYFTYKCKYLDISFLIGFVF